MRNLNKFEFGKLAIIFICGFIITFIFINGIWNKNKINLDVPSYYSYLPAVIIHQEINLKFAEKKSFSHPDKIWFYKLPNGNNLIKHPAGLAVALSPFFVFAHLLAIIIDAEKEGYSLLYQNFTSIGVLVYLVLGLIFLRKFLNNFYSDKIVGITIIILTLGTNFLWYASFEILMPHIVSFSILSISLHKYHKYLLTGEASFLIIFAVGIGMSVLIRPLAIMFLIYFFIYGIFLKKGVKNYFKFLFKNSRYILIATLLFLLIISIQLLYWKVITNSWIFDPYINERFIFSQPEMIAFLFGFRKGLFIYFPLLLLILPGFYFLIKRDMANFLSTFSVLVVSIFILSSWWAWSYGISWGLRPMIDYYPILAIPLACGIQLLFNNFKKKSIYLLITAFIFLNLFQTWQYKNGLIHYDDMTMEAYFKGFLKFQTTQSWRDALRPYDWERRLKGYPQVKYSKELLGQIAKTESLYFTGYNLRYITTNPDAAHFVAAFSSKISGNEIFNLILLSGDTFAIMSQSGLYWSVSDYENVIAADANEIGNNEKFFIDYIKEDNNIIAFKSYEGNYLTVSMDFPFALHARAKERGEKETFRFFMKDY